MFRASEICMNTVKPKVIHVRVKPKGRVYYQVEWSTGRRWNPTQQEYTTDRNNWGMQSLKEAREVAAKVGGKVIRCSEREEKA